MLLSGLHGLASITFRGNQLISGVALNFLASGLTVLIAESWFRQGGRTPSLLTEGRFNGIELPFAIGPAEAEAAGRPLSELIGEANVIQQIWSELISGHSILVYVAALMVPLTWWVLFRTRFGLRLRAVGKTRPPWTPPVFPCAGCALPQSALRACSVASPVRTSPPAFRRVL